MSARFLGPTPTWQPGPHNAAGRMAAALAADIFGRSNGSAQSPWWEAGSPSPADPSPWVMPRHYEAAHAMALRYAARARRTGHKIRARALIAAARRIRAECR